MNLTLHKPIIFYWIDSLLKAISMLALLFTVSVHAEVLVCVDEQGKTIYTDDRGLCNGEQDKQLSVNARPLKTKNNKGKVNYRIPQRDYEQAASSYKVFIERELTNGDPKLALEATHKLEATLKDIFSVLPEASAQKLSKLRFYLMWGESSPKGGRKSGMAYFRTGEHKRHPYLDLRWENVIVIYSAKNLMYLDTLWAKKALMHELAHAWHLNNWPEKYEPILRSYHNAKKLGLYLNVKDYKGKKILKAYAIKNQLEYFAELSAMYFVGGNYEPFNKNKLKIYDRTGFLMIKSLWK